MKAEMGHPKYRPDIDGLRAVAVLAVVGFHAFPSIFKSGYVGVDIFFIISGFLISAIIFANLQNQTFSLQEFYSRRVRRIFPALSFVLIACLIFGWMALFTDEYAELGKQTASGVGFVSNFLYWKEAGYFDVAAETKPLLHLWSLAIEEQFYIFWPLLMYAAYRLRINFLYLAGAVIVGSLYYGAFMVRTDLTGAFYSPGSRFWEMAFGSVLALIVQRKWDSQFPGHRFFKNLLSAVGLILITITVFKKERYFPGCWAILSTTGAVMYIFAGSESWLNKYVLSQKPAIWVGLISYPLYLWHWPLLSFSRIIEVGPPSFPIRVMAVVLSFGLAILTYFLVENPLRNGLNKRRIAWSLSGLMAGIGIAGYFIFLQPSFLPQMAHASPFQDPHKLPAAERCLSSIKEFGDVDKCASNVGVPKIALIGDSHAGHYYSGLMKTDLPISVIWNGGCPPLGTLEYDRHQCPERWQTIQKYVEAHKDQIKVVILSAYYQLYLFEKDALGRENKVHLGIKQEMEKSGVTESKNDVRNLLQKGLDESIAFFEKNGIQVGLMMDVPTFPYQPQACFKNARPFTFGTKPNECSPLSKSKLAVQQEPVKEMVAVLQKDHPNLKVFDPTLYLCDQDQCQSIIGGDLIYRDDDHLSERGSLKISEKVEGWIKANFMM